MKKQTKKRDRPAANTDAGRLYDFYQGAKNDARKLTQEKMVEHMGMGQSAISQYLQGTIPLNIRALIKFATLFGVGYDEISPSLAEEMQTLNMKRPGNRFGASKKPPRERIEEALSDLFITSRLKDKILAMIDEMAIEAAEVRKEVQAELKKISHTKPEHR